MKDDKKPLRGVNLGGWFVLEKWMTPSIFKGTQATDELTLVQEKGGDVIRGHRKNFIKETDFAWLKSQGVEIIRVPVGYWVLEDQDGYISSPEILDWCMEMASKYDIKVLIGLHAAPGAQNSSDHGGNGSGKKPQWFKRVNRERSTKVLHDIANRYSGNSSLWGISLLNEPTSLGLLRYIKLRLWTHKTISSLQRVLPSSVRLVISDAYLFNFWYRVEPRAVLDIHHYQCHSRKDKLMTKASDHLNRVGKIWSRYRKMLGSRRYIVGEWSAVLPASVGATPAVKQQYLDEQLASFNDAEAVFYWSYKTEHSGGWNFRSMIENGFKL